MLGKARKLIANLLVPAAFLYLVFVAAFLQEFSPDQIPELADAAQLAVPLADPHIVVRTDKMTLELLDGDTLIKRYDIGFGKDHAGLRLAKRGELTPFGIFKVVSKEKRKGMFSRGSRFIRLDYPNEEIARRAYDQDAISEEEFDRILNAIRFGDPPPTDTSLGGPLGIQGNYFFFRSRNFTDGSVALSNGDLNEIYEHIVVGMTVEITDQ